MAWELERASPDHHGFLYALAATVPEQWPRLCRRGLPDPHELPIALWAGVVHQVVVCRGGVPVGVASLHDVEPGHGTGWIDAVVLPGGDLAGARGAAAWAVVHHGFEALGLRLLYENHRGIDGSALAEAGLPAVEEARLADHWWADGQWWDRIITAVDRTGFSRVAGTP